MVHVPRNIDQDFLSAASSNTRRNVETCGTLAGKLVSVCLHCCILLSYVSIVLEGLNQCFVTITSPIICAMFFMTVIMLYACIKGLFCENYVKVSK